MKAIIPVAGHGTRLEPYSLNCQKCLLPVAGKPILEHILDRLTSAGICHITIIVGYLGEQVKDFCQGYLKAKFTFIEQTKQLGLGHAVYQGLDQSDEPVVIALGDSIIELDYPQFISSAYSTIGVDQVPDPQRFGIAELDGDQIVDMIEKPKNPPSNLALIGIYYISSQKELAKGIEFLMENDLCTYNEYQLTDALKVMIKGGHIFKAFEIDNCLDCGIPSAMISTNQTLLKQGGVNVIHPTAIINNSVLNHCTISKNCSVIDSNLNNVIMLSGSKVKKQRIESKIIGFDEYLEEESSI